MAIAQGCVIFRFGRGQLEAQGARLSTVEWPRRVGELFWYDRKMHYDVGFHVVEAQRSYAFPFLQLHQRRISRWLAVMVRDVTGMSLGVVGVLTGG